MDTIQEGIFNVFSYCQGIIGNTIGIVNNVIDYTGVVTNGVLSYLTSNNLVIDDRLVRALVLMTGLVATNYTIYNILDWVLMRTSNAYPALSHADKRYVVKNLSKSGVLLGLLLTILRPLWNMLIYNQWDNEIIAIIGTVYASTDLTGLIFVPNLPRATKIHHTCVMIIATINVFMDYTQDGLHRAFISLTVLSMIPYLVNTYLGMRHLEGAKLKQWIIKICLWVYSVSVLFNCFLQHAYVFWLVPDYSLHRCVIKAAYLMIYYFILNDDIKLIKYLHYKYQEELGRQSMSLSPCIVGSTESQQIQTKVEDVPKRHKVRRNKGKKSRKTKKGLQSDFNLVDDKVLNILLVHNDVMNLTQGSNIQDLESNYESCSEDI